MFLRCVVCGRRSPGWVVNAAHAHANSHAHGNSVSRWHPAQRL